MSILRTAPLLSIEGPPGVTALGLRITGSPASMPAKQNLVIFSHILPGNIDLDQVNVLITRDSSPQKLEHPSE